MAKTDWKRSLSDAARKCDEAEEGLACAGTKLEATTFTVKKKAFVFLAADSVRVKLDASLAEAKKLGCDIGKQGWVKIDMTNPPSLSTMKRWIAESHDLFSGR